ncbi:SRPBCC family protein [Kutzneria sp. NPDC052558]|uniref:SRPBCC family protein n=1 Tax=Kutzneria sp. NPDC052558 TaxID=3364121 RepID=UPI0037C953FC
MECTVAQSFEDSARNLWRTISDFGSVGRYCPAVIECTVDGRYRTLVAKDPTGQPFQYQERLEAIDQDTMRLTYSMPDTSGFPMQDGYLATMAVSELSAERCLLTWSATLEPRDTTPTETMNFIIAVYQSMFDGLRELHR